jgi:hypothetical protein
MHEIQVFNKYQNYRLNSNDGLWLNACWNFGLERSWFRKGKRVIECTESTQKCSKFSRISDAAEKQMLGGTGCTIETDTFSS